MRKATQTRYSFKRGWDNLRAGDTKACRMELMNAIGVTSRASFLACMKGLREPKISEYLAIEEIFHKYGVTDIWGEPDRKETKNA